MSRPMQITFDRGTLLLDGPTERVASLPRVLWDPRVGRYRAPAFAYSEITAALAGETFVDLVHPAPLLDAPAIDLRPYQQAALDAW